MPRQLGDVLHYFAPELEGDTPRAAAAPGTTALAVPVAEADLVRTAFVWNLAVELARLGERPALLAAGDQEAGPFWSRPGRGPLGVEIFHANGGEAELASALAELRSTREKASFVLVPLSPAGFDAFGRADPEVDGVLVLVRPEARALDETLDTLERAARSRREIALGASLFGVESRSEAERAFDRLAEMTLHRIGRTLHSYGLLVDDLHLCRSILTGRPVGLSHPHSPAARALADVARLLRADAEDGPLA